MPCQTGLLWNLIRNTRYKFQGEGLEIQRLHSENGAMAVEAGRAKFKGFYGGYELQKNNANKIVIDCTRERWKGKCLIYQAKPHW